MAAPQRQEQAGLIGAGIQRSLTPAMQMEEARHHGIDLHYRLIDLDLEGRSAADLPRLVDQAQKDGYLGLNITYPCKQAVVPLLDELSPEARDMGAVNTVVFRGGRRIGHNTDGSGWSWGFRRALPKADLSRVVLLGAGGAGSAIAHAVLRLGAARLQIVDLDVQRTDELVARLRTLHGDRVAGQRDIAAALESATGLIHATPTGMDKLPGLPLPAELLRPPLWVAEVVYFPLETELLQAARARGCETVDGGTMAVGQAVGAFELFTGLQPQALRMERHFRQLVLGRQPQR